MTQETIVAFMAALFSAFIGVAITGFIWIIKLGNRVALLENGHTMLSRTLELEQKALASGLREIRSELQGVNVELKTTREEMLRWFTPSEDFRRLEDKVDALHAVVLKPPQVGRARPRQLGPHSE